MINGKSHIMRTYYTNATGTNASLLDTADAADEQSKHDSNRSQCIHKTTIQH